MSEDSFADGIAEPLTGEFTDFDRRQTSVATAVIVLVLVPAFLVVGRWGVYANPDVIAAAVPAWQFANEGTLNVAEYPIIADNLNELGIWFIEVAPGEIYSNRPPGLIAIAVPAYQISGPQPFTNAPATLTALIATLLAVLIAAYVVRGWVGVYFATAFALVLGLGTTTWNISASQLWPHGPGQLWSAAALLALSTRRDVFAGTWFAVAILTRPVMAVLAFLSGFGEAVRRRSLRAFLVIGGIAFLGVAVLVFYNHGVFGAWSVRGGYSSNFTTGALERFAPSAYLKNLSEMFLGYRGVLTSSPVIGISAYAAIRYRSRIPGWAKTAAFAALGYLAVHALLNRASGAAIVFYRYPLEPLILASAALCVGAYHLWKSGPMGRLLLIVSSVLSILLQVLNAFYFSCWLTLPVHSACILS